MTRLERPDQLRYDSTGLVAAVAQDVHSGAVLMIGFADARAVETTLKTGLMHYHSRSRGRLWKKGETSGNVQRVVGLFSDCDGDALLALVHQDGPACHTGAATCFVAADEVPVPQPARLAQRIAGRSATTSAASYTTRLLGDANLRLKKIGEEATELVLALRGEGVDRVAAEAADVIYHLLVACHAAGVPWRAIAQELTEREQ